MTLNHLIQNGESLKVKNPKMMLEKYRCGELDESIFESTNFLESDSDTEMISLQERIKHDMIISRNKRMAERLHEFFEDKKDDVIFVAIGAGRHHLH